ncbi:hypothetical protein MUP05_05375 [Candidatus Bathyarchaeota archaeon]|nr:hypothetical protein [Candidatus Bathyarchaeota archaeon]
MEKSEKSIGIIVSDLDDLRAWIKLLMEKHPSILAPLPTEYFLEIMSIHILIVAILEYSLRYVGRRMKYYQLIDYVSRSPVLTDLEKDWLILLILRRHTIVHNFAHADDELCRDTKKYIKKLKVVPGERDSWLTPFTLQECDMCLGIVRKLMILDIVSDRLTTEQRDMFKRDLEETHR